VVPRPANWEDDAGIDPETGEPWKVKDMATKANRLLGTKHTRASKRRRLDWEATLSEAQRKKLRRAGVKRPRKHD
jgi:hypothetical protein